MSRRRRIALVTAAVLASFAGTTAAHAGLSPAGDTENRHGDWVCVGVETIDYGYCQGNPLPDRLPLPEDRPRL